MRIRTMAAAAALACVTVLGGATAATAAPADPPPSNSQHDEGPTGLGLNLLCGIGLLGQGSCGN
ncbi:hypothetical protein AB0Q95_34450 [Streptomyces sp. NPDC059900]|uniref:hypothetical protein n=1 Tax=Streptomyces sp. NPDC059900 TaxID=3155816 RepID=UPI003416C70F